MKHFRLKFNHGVEIGAFLAYMGHYKRTKNTDVLDIAIEETEHRQTLINILEYYGEESSYPIDSMFSLVGYTIYWLCQISPNWALNLVARSMEAFAVYSYGRLAVLYPDFEYTLRSMAKNEYEHEKYFKEL